MDNRDVSMLDPEEQKVLDLSFQPGLSEKRMRNIVINAVIVLAALAAFFAYGFSEHWLAAMAAVILVISAVEKVSYARAMMRYKSLVRKLVHRVEQLEGANLTALGSHPAAQLRRQRELDRADVAQSSGTPMR